MTVEEKSTVTRRGFTYGLWVAASVVLPLQVIFMGFATGKLNLILATIGGLLILAHIVCIPIWQRRQRQFLCNTVWARKNGINPDILKLFNWNSTKDSG